eukprot:6180570-Pleurochrysis_carterae.AAC.3
MAPSPKASSKCGHAHAGHSSRESESIREGGCPLLNALAGEMAELLLAAAAAAAAALASAAVPRASAKGDAVSTGPINSGGSKGTPSSLRNHADSAALRRDGNAVRSASRLG